MATTPREDGACARIASQSRAKRFENYIQTPDCNGDQMDNIQMIVDGVRNGTLAFDDAQLALAETVGYMAKIIAVRKRLGV